MIFTHTVSAILRDLEYVEEGYLLPIFSICQNGIKAQDKKSFKHMQSEVLFLN